MAAEVEPDLKLEIAHVLTIDLVAYSTLLIHEQTRVMRELNRIVRDAPCFRAAEAAGKLTRLPTGDGMALVFFGDPEAPIRCATEIAGELKSPPAISVRMGIHSGPINQILDVNDRSNVAGAGIDMAQRVMDCGDAGHILLSKRVADDLSAYPRWHGYLHDLGECEVKHGRRIGVFNFYTDELGNPGSPKKFSQPDADESRHGSASSRVGRRNRTWVTVGVATLGTIAILLVLVAVIRHRSRTPPRLGPKSIAVLPFENRSEDKANAYFADGLQDEILTRLSMIADLTVVSRTSSQHYKSTPDVVPAIARQLGVAYVVEGGVQKIGEAARINVQVIDAATDSHVWALTFDRKMTDIFSVQSDLARAIANHLQAHVTAQEEQRVVMKATNNPAAYDAYLRGLAYTLKAATTPGNTLGAQRYLREAVQLDPNFALAWALLSYVNSLSYLSVDLQRTEALREEARLAAETALKLQPHLGEALHAMGFYYYACLNQYDMAVQYFEQARRLLPNSSRVPLGLAYVARRQGDWDRSEAFFNEAERLDPLNVKLLTQRALSYVQLREFARARQKLDQILELTPDEVDTIALKAGVAQAEGNLAEAAALLSPLQPRAENFLALEQQVYQAMLERAPQPMIARLNEVLSQTDVSAGYAVAELRLWLGWLQELADDSAAARASWERARQELESLSREQPQNFIVTADLALVNGVLGDEQTAFSLAHAAVAIVAEEKDAVATHMQSDLMARIAARAGDASRAIPALEQLLNTPYDSALASGVPLTPALLRLDPMFDRIREDPRFARLLETGGKPPR